MGMVCISNLISSGKAICRVVWGCPVLGFLQETTSFAVLKWFLRHGRF